MLFFLLLLLLVNSAPHSSPEAGSNTSKLFANRHKTTKKKKPGSSVKVLGKIFWNNANPGPCGKMGVKIEIFRVSSKNFKTNYNYV